MHPLASPGAAGQRLRKGLGHEADGGRGQPSRGRKALPGRRVEAAQLQVQAGGLGIQGLILA